MMTEKESSPPLSGGTEQEKLKQVDLSVKREVSGLPSNRKQDIVNNLATLLEIDSGKINIKPLEKSNVIRLEMSEIAADYLYKMATAHNRIIDLGIKSISVDGKDIKFSNKLFDFQYLGKDIVIFGILTVVLFFGLPYVEDQKGFQFLNLPGRPGFPWLPGLIFAVIIISLFALALYLFGVNDFKALEEVEKKDSFPINIISVIVSKFDPRLFHPIIWIGFLASGAMAYVWNTPPRQCLQSEIIRVRFHIEQVGKLSATDLAPNGTFYAEPNADYDLKVVVKRTDTNTNPLPTFDCAWQDGGPAIPGGLTGTKGCGAIGYHSGMGGIYDPVIVVLTEPKCPSLPPYSFSIVDQ